MIRRDQNHCGDIVNVSLNTNDFRIAKFSRQLMILVLATSLSVNAASVIGSKPVKNSTAGVLTLAMAVDRAVVNNPGLLQMEARFRALQEIPSQQGSLPDPVLSLNALNLPSDTFHVGQEPMTQMQIGLSQAFPFPGKLALREEVSTFEAQAAGYSADEARLGLISQVKITWWQLYYLDRALIIIDVNQNFLRNFAQVAKTRYEVADGRQQDVLLAQLEVSKLLDEKIQLRALRRNQAIELNLLMDRPVEAVISLPDIAAEDMPDIAAEAILHQQAQSHRPLLQAMEKRVDAAKSRVALAKKDYYPDFKIGMAYGDRRGENPGPQGGSRDDFVSLMFSVNLPLRTASRQSKALSQRTEELIGNRYALQDRSSLVRSRISLASTDYQRARQQFSLFKTGIVPQAQQTVASMLAAYRVDEVDFLNLVRSQVTLFNYQLRYWRALSDANQALARLVAATGGENIYE